MFCVHCGTELEDDALFCHSCGASTAEDAKGEEPKRGAVEGSAAGDGGSGKADSGSAPPTAPSVAPPDESPMRGGPQKGPKGFRVFLIVAAALIVVLLAALVTLLALGGIPGQTASSSAPSDSASPALPDDGGRNAAAGGKSEKAPIVPDVVDMTEDEAVAALEEAGLTAGSISREPSGDADEGTVIGQTPSAGREAPSGKVNLVVSKGPETEIVHEYELVSQQMTWTEARDYCEDRGGYLACITSQEEYDTVLELAQGRYEKVFWLGGVRKADGGFQWVSGEPFSFEDWGPGEPNNDGGRESCLALFDAQGAWGWYDVPNDLSDTYSADRMAFIVEYEVERPAS